MKQPLPGWVALPIFCLYLWSIGSAAVGKGDVVGVAAPAPLLQLEDLKRQVHSLSDYKGKVVLINFWASWCGPCIAEMPSLRRLYETMAEAPFEILAVNVEEGRFKVHKFSRLLELPFPVLLDAKGETFATWGARVLPTSFLIDPEGRVHEKVEGPLDWGSAKVLETIRRLLPTTTPALTSAPGSGAIATSGSPAG